MFKEICLKQKVCLMEKKVIVNYWKTPKGNRLVEICVPYDKIREMHWNAELCRLEISAEYKYITFKNNVANEQVVNNKPIIIYGYFGSMDKMMNQLENYTNKKITGRV